MEQLTRIKFDNSRRDNIGLVREILLRRLREDGADWHQFKPHDQGFDRFLEFPSGSERSRFEDLLRQVIWELVATGVIAPGNDLDYRTTNIPYFSITDYGRTVLSAGQVIPHDPDGYLVEIREAGKACVDIVALGYIQEALCCFTRGCHTASVLLLGVAAEAVILKICEILVDANTKFAVRREYESLPDSAKQKHRWLVKRYHSLPPKVRRNNLPDGLDVTLTSAYDLIRRQRNDLGHPQAIPPEVDRQHAFVFFQVFLTVVRDLEAFAKYSS
jgi:hypothetical protein